MATANTFFCFQGFSEPEERLSDDRSTQVLSNDPTTAILSHPQATVMISQSVPPPAPNKLTAEEVRNKLRRLGIMEEVVILEMPRAHFLREEGIKELGRGGEGAVYFLRGHVVKLVEAPYARAALREVAHILALNPLRDMSDGLLSSRSRADIPTLIWMYVLDDGGLAIGMEPFDKGEKTGMTLDARLTKGPPMRGDYLLRTILSMARTLAYMHQSGVLHHDLKPANVYLPADAMRDPIVFDLGQALWARRQWGKEWLKQEHNAAYWYNGSFRYMHYPRRLAHLAAIEGLQKRNLTPKLAAALQGYTPNFFADVFAFARMLREISHSPMAKLAEQDRASLFDFSRRLMGLNRQPTVKKATSKSWLPQIFQAKPKPEPVVQLENFHSMERVVTELEKVLMTFEILL